MKQEIKDTLRPGWHKELAAAVASKYGFTGTVTAVSEATKVNRDTVKKILDGDIDSIGLESLMIVADHLGITLR